MLVKHLTHKVWSMVNTTRPKVGAACAVLHRCFVQQTCCADLCVRQCGGILLSRYFRLQGHEVRAARPDLC